jgi:hypothetical protein
MWRLLLATEYLRKKTPIWQIFFCPYIRLPPFLRKPNDSWIRPLPMRRPIMYLVQHQVRKLLRKQPQRQVGLAVPRIHRMMKNLRVDRVVRGLNPPLLPKMKASYKHHLLTR